MQYLWTWGGKFFGYRADDDLWTYTGRHVGRFNGNEVYDRRGRYLGEVIDDRLIRNRMKRLWRSGIFMPYMNRVSLVKLVDYVGFVMYVGHDDFLPPEAFHSENRVGLSI